MKKPATITAALSKGYIVQNNSERNEWLSDEPIEAGGKDKGPRPTELFLSSLASCKLITCKMYAERKGWDLKKAEIFLTLLKEDGKTFIDKKIEFTGELDDSQIVRLLDISSRCPVAKLIDPSIKIRLIQ